ncbi:uncharacterized protein LOC123197545 [Mangifera indica]|uniref:uncharacterized protein LOC123197545 n=1 Tax=Mangifera indica TaxID=29780 RepID=UPI001CF9E1FD|nr:uncharacterized protein LOC123197545 [Mangifera indica]XP_044467805.1 uncharacterized protein LOC123197545 [Mangifera indica]
MLEKGTGLCSSMTEANKPWPFRLELATDHIRWDSLCSSSVRQANKSWPFRLKLTRDHIRWDSLKISPSQEFEDHILRKLDEGSCKILESWIPIEIHIFDADIQETYRVKLTKKKSFWFEPLPDGKQEQKNNLSFHGNKGMNEFSYSLEPFRHIITTRNLRCGKEIGLCWSGSSSIIKFDFSVLYSPMLEPENIRICNVS